MTNNLAEQPSIECKSVRIGCARPSVLTIPVIKILGTHMRSPSMPTKFVNIA